ncbi:MAG: glycosyltransferase family 4 protein [Bacteroidales bacterium]|nr:glycosyltransferase family 4 protein [Bacteroidales bacterium]
MRVLMFGWEFPPHISGGLGTASYGLTRGMSAMKDMDVLFVVPLAHGDEDQSAIKLIGANNVKVAYKKIYYKGKTRTFDKIEVESRIVPYTDPDDFWKLTREKQSSSHKIVETNSKGKLDFTGKYGDSLLQEIEKYAIVASVIASENEFDVIHAHDWLAYPAGIAASRVSGKPLVIHVHATDFDRSGGKVNPVVYNMEKVGMEEADRIIAVSNLTRDTVINRYGMDPAKVTTVYNAVEPVDDIMRNPLKRNIEDKVVTFLGRITMQKGPEYFIEAAYLVLQRMHNVRFVMAGSGDMMEKMMRHAASLNITDRFHFTGFLKGQDVYSMLQLSDVYIMPSVSEPFGISPLEAMQTNVPVIISKQSGVAEILTHAVKVDFWDIDATADAIHAILSYPAMSGMFKKEGKTEVESLKWENSARSVRKVYESAINN